MKVTPFLFYILKFVLIKNCYYLCNQRFINLIWINMKLNVATRLTLLMSLPEQGTVTEMISKRNVRKKIDFSSDEVEAIKLTTGDGKVSWSPKAEPIEVSFSASEITFLQSIIDRLDKAGQITDNLLDFIEQINSATEVKSSE